MCSRSKYAVARLHRSKEHLSSIILPTHGSIVGENAWPSALGYQIDCQLESGRAVPPQVERPCRLDPAPTTLAALIDLLPMSGCIIFGRMLL
jgi:hypothetical protein